MYRALAKSVFRSYTGVPSLTVKFLISHEARSNSAMNIQQPLWRAPLLISDAEDVDELDAQRFATGEEMWTMFTLGGPIFISSVCTNVMSWITRIHRPLAGRGSEKP